MDKFHTRTRTSQNKPRDFNYESCDTAQASLAATTSSSNFVLNNKSLAADFSLDHSLCDSGYSSSHNHHSTYNPMTTSTASSYSVQHLKLARITEDNECVGMNISPIPSPLATPTTASIRKFDALQLNSPTLNSRSPVKRQISMTHNYTVREGSVTPKKILKVMEDRNEIMAATSQYTTPKKFATKTTTSKVLTPVNHRKFQRQNSMRFGDKEMAHHINSHSIHDRTPLSPFNVEAHKSKATKVKHEKGGAMNKDRSTSQRSLSTSTPKFNEETENYPKHITRSGSSPCKKRRLIKKFQSFSPVKFIKNQENIFVNGSDVENARKRLFERNNSQNILAQKQQQKKLLLDAIPTKSSEQQHSGNNSRLDSIREEELKPTEIDIVTRDVLEGDSIFQHSFSLIEDKELSFDMKYQNLINEPIKCLADPEFNEGPSELSDNIFITPRKANDKLEETNALYDSFVDDNVDSNLSSSAIESYFHKMKETIVADENRSKSQNHMSVDLGFSGPRDSLELWDDEDYVSPSKGQDCRELLGSLLTKPILTSPLEERSKTANVPKALLHSAEYEKTQILHAQIPKTPSKLNRRKSLKRLSSSKIPFYKKQIRTGYEGIKRLNIFDHLKGCDLIIDQILEYLADADLVRVSMVSKSYRAMIESNFRSRERKMDYLKRTVRVKENLKNTKTTPNKKVAATKIIRGPLMAKNYFYNRTNLSNESSLESSSSVESPSKFNENQRLVNRLSKNAKLTKCPLCDRSCEIIEPEQTISPRRKQETPPRKRLFSSMDPAISPRKVSKVKKAFSLPHQNSFEDFSKPNLSKSLPYNLRESKNTSRSAHSIFDESFSSSMRSQQSKYGSQNLQNVSNCSRCNYVFCVNCNSASHPDKECTLIEVSSPSREEEKPLRRSIAGSKQSKKNLKRLL